MTEATNNEAPGHHPPDPERAWKVQALALLDNYPLTKHLLGDQLKIRSCHCSSDWLLNSQLRGLARKSRGPELRVSPLDRLEGLFQTVNSESSEELLNAIFRGIQPDTDGFEFDRRTADALVEVRCLQWLQGQHFQNIEKLAAKGPDFRASKNGHQVLVEAKRVRNNDDWVLHLAMDHFEAAFVRHSVVPFGRISISRSGKYTEAALVGDIPGHGRDKGRALRSQMADELGEPKVVDLVQRLSDQGSVHLEIAEGYLVVSRADAPIPMVMTSGVSVPMQWLITVFSTLSHMLGKASGALGQAFQSGLPGTGITPTQYVVYLWVDADNADVDVPVELQAVNPALDVLFGKLPLQENVPASFVVVLGSLTWHCLRPELG